MVSSALRQSLRSAHRTFNLGRWIALRSPIHPTWTRLKIDTSDYIVRKHNCLRTLPQASNMLQMQWNKEAAKQAQKWADGCVYEHGPANRATSRKFHEFIRVVSVTHH